MRKSGIELADVLGTIAMPISGGLLYEGLDLVIVGDLNNRIVDELRKNMCDVFDYSFEMKAETIGEITFICCNKHFWNGFRSLYHFEYPTVCDGLNQIVLIDQSGNIQIIKEK